jgi:hypothetical protein
VWLERLIKAAELQGAKIPNRWAVIIDWYQDSA